MTIRSLVRVFVAWAILLTIVCEGIILRYRLKPAEGPIVASVWVKGELAARDVVQSGRDSTPALDKAMENPGAMRTNEIVVQTSPLLTFAESLFSVSLVSARDGVKITYDGKVDYVTPDELLSQRGYDHGIQEEGLGISLGVDVQLVVALAAQRLHVRASDVLAHATFERIRTRREVPGQLPTQRIEPGMLDHAMVLRAVADAGRYLGRGVGTDGKFRYLVAASSNLTISGYDWPRHSGATYFLAQAAALTQDPEMTAAALRAAGLLRDRETARCGQFYCIGQEDMVDLGSAALATVAYVQIGLTLDPSYKEQVKRLTPFLRAMQRPDGEFMHQYDRVKKTPIDIQLPYYSGEATLALVRAYTVTHDPKDLEAAKAGLDRIVGGAWSFFGNRYYFGEEHWTCQAMDDLWQQGAENPRALDFCMRWQAYMRKMQLGAKESPHDGDGAYTFDPVLTPRLTPAASRCEAGVASLDAARRSGKYSSEELAAVDWQLRRALALILRQQFSPGPTHLFADPAAVNGAIPGSEVDWEIRIDYAQHAGSAMVRWLDVVAPQ